VYNTCQEFLDLRCGDYEEHAILLCNYFTFLDQKLQKDKEIETFLVYGFTVPEGDNVYVGRKHITDNTIELWDPVNGDCYYYSRSFITSKFLCCECKTGLKVDSGSMDTLCPLKSVSCIITKDNAYVNLQFDQSPA